jgi:hypothetical protein
MKNKPQEEFEELTEADIEEIPELPEDLLEEEAEEPSLEDLVKRGEAKIKEAGKAAREVEQKGEARIETVAGNIGLSPKDIERVKQGVGFEKKKAGVVKKIKTLVADTQELIKSWFGDKQEIEMSGKKEPFDPAEEYKKVKEITESNASVEEKEQVLKEYKKELMAQKSGIARLQDDLRKTIEANSDLPVEELMKKVASRGGELRLTEKQKEFFKEFLEEYHQKHEKIKSVREQYPEDRELFKASFGLEPVGKIKVEQGPMSFYFKCYNPEDYANVMRKVYEEHGKIVSEEKVEVAKRGTTGMRLPYSLLPDLRGLLIIENTRLQKLLLMSSRKTQIHEEQHVLYELFEKRRVKADIGEKLLEAKNREDKIDAVLEILRIYRRNNIFERLAQGEFLSYLREGKNPGEVVSKLLQSKERQGAYDYYNAKKEGILADITKEFGIDREIAEMASDKVFKNEYSGIIEDAGRAIKRLQNTGMSNDEIVEFLSIEPLEQWPNLVRHMKQVKRGK